MSSKYCHCGKEIPAGRLKIFPDATTCADCSPVVKHFAVPGFDHKTGGSPVIIPGHDAEGKRLLTQQYLGRPGRGWQG